MKHLALIVAGWWVTWVLFGLAAYFGSVALICWAICRFTRIQDRKLAAETEHAADRTPWPTPAAYLDPIDDLATAITCTWCRPVRSGLCSCTGLCPGDGRCIRGGALRLTAADRAFLAGRIQRMPR